jgi:hypothetical protein
MRASVVFELGISNANFECYKKAGLLAADITMTQRCETKIGSKGVRST